MSKTGTYTLSSLIASDIPAAAWMLDQVSCSHWDRREALSTALAPGGENLSAHHISQIGLALGDAYEAQCIRASLV